ncbi:glycoside hydrolase [Dichotomopilus funicola]|uniref:Glycoside hydrolase n=1 Tax=Dichotomopilus funicola TaxID=1934379 RepID=A0AAN6V1I5_9PEZI|nr:glycoside hydrolase [Dichotomopilus funicola]
MQLSLLLLSSVAAATPLTAVDKRQTATLCEQYGYWSGNGYEVNNNNWGKDAGSGQQCTYVDNASSSGVTWHTTWNWSGGENNVKSYANCGLQVPAGRLVSSINSMKTSVSWTLTNSNVRADVAYDIFTAADPNHDHSSGDYELMIWLARLGDVYPIGTSQGNVNVAGQNWDLWVGNNGAMKVFSFIAGSPVNSFNADVKEFYTYLESSQGFPSSSQYLLTFQMGTEPFTGEQTTLTVNNYSVNLA